MRRAIRRRSIGEAGDGGGEVEVERAEDEAGRGRMARIRDVV